jgi:hypothetical protein
MSRTMFSAPPMHEISEREDERLRVQATFKKNMLDNQINAYITGKQRLNIADELIKKREALVQEKRELQAEVESLEEKLSHSEGSASDDDKVILIQQQRQEASNRLEIVDAEIRYYSARIKSLQLEAAHEPSMLTSGDDTSGIENALDVVKSLDPIEAQKLLELMLEDIVALRLADRTKQMEVQQLEKDNEDLRKAMKFLRTHSLGPRRSSILSNHQVNNDPFEDVASKSETGSVMNDIRDLAGDFNEIDFALGTCESAVDIFLLIH